MTKRILGLSAANFIQLSAVAVALALGIVNLFRTCAQDAHLEDLAFQNTSLQHRPLVKVLGRPDILEFKFLFAGKDFLPRQDSTIQTAMLPTGLTVRLRLTLVNVGNALAKVYLIASLDTTTGEDRIRQILRSFQSCTNDSSFFHNLEVLPGDSTHYQVERTIQSIADNTFTVHFLFLYANDFNSVYDTYYWARFKQRAIESRAISGHVVRLVYRPTQASLRASEVLTLDTTNFSSKAYSRNESKEIIERLNPLASTPTK